MATALLVIDMQNFFAPMVTSSLPNVLQLIAHFRSHNLPVIFTQHGHSDEELTPPFRNMLVKKWGPDNSVRIGTKDWELIPSIRDLVRDDFPVVPKNTYDGFLGTPLSELLVKAGVEKIAVCGVMTDCCCDTTARAAFNRGFDTCLVGDACGTTNAVQHERGLAVFEYAYGDIVSTDDVLKSVQG